MDLISYLTAEEDGIRMTTTVFNPTGVHIWEIPRKNINPPGVIENYQAHGTLISRDPITGEMTSKIETNNGNRVDGWFKPGIQHEAIAFSGGRAAAWVWANAGSGPLIEAKVKEYYSKPENKSPHRVVDTAVGLANPQPQA